MTAKVSQVRSVTALSIVKIRHPGMITMDNVMDEVASNEPQSSCYDYPFQISPFISKSYVAIFTQGQAKPPC